MKTMARSERTMPSLLLCRLTVFYFLMINLTGRHVSGAARNAVEPKAEDKDNINLENNVLNITHDDEDDYFHRPEKESERWHHDLYDNLRRGVEASAHNLLHSMTEVPLEVPMEINVVLVGCDGDGGYRYMLEPDNLAAFLKKSFPKHRPSCLETGHVLEVFHELQYHVIKAGWMEVMALEKYMRNSMKHVGNTSDPFGAGRSTAMVDVYDVPAEGVEKLFDQLYWFAFGEKVRDSQLSGHPKPAAIFIFNFDKARMDPRKDVEVGKDMDSFRNKLSGKELTDQESGYIYRYRYMGGAPTQVWLASDRYVVVDLSAGPCTHGQLGAEQGAVGKLTIPRVRNVVLPRAYDTAAGGFGRKHAPHPYEYLRGQIAHIVMSAVEHIFAADVRFESLDAAHRVLVPVIVMRNHRRYNPLRPGHNHSIDMELVEREIKKMVQPGQELVVVSGIFNLHDHEQVAMAVAKSQRSISTFENLGDWKILMQTRTFLDGHMLVDEMRHSPDMLAAGLLEMADPHLSSMFFNPKLLDIEPVEEQETGVLKQGSVESPKRSSGPGRTRKPVRHYARSHGTRVLPIYVMSLAGMDPGLMMAGESGFVATEDAVVVLQTNNDSIPLSYVSENAKWTANCVSVTRDIVAGAAMALAGLAAPYERYSPLHEKKLDNWLWSNGHHPFGPFTNCSTISQLLLDNIVRNTVYSRADTALRILRKSLNSVQAFAEDYLSTPLGEPVSTEKKSRKPWIDKLYKDPTASFQPFPQTVSDAMTRKLTEMEGLMVDLSGLLYNHQYAEAHEKSTTMFRYVKSFQEYADEEVSAAKDRMRCCQVKHAPPSHSSQTLLYAAILGTGFLVYFVVIYFASPQK